MVRRATLNKEDIRTTPKRFNWRAADNAASWTDFDFSVSSPIAVTGGVVSKLTVVLSWDKKKNQSKKSVDLPPDGTATVQGSLHGNIFWGPTKDLRGKVVDRTFGVIGMLREKWSLGVGVFF